MELGNAGRSAGLPMPPFKGANEAPIGFSEGWPGLTVGDIPGRENILSFNEGVAAGAGGGLDPSNCLNRARFICCAAFGAGNGVGEPNNFDWPPLWLCLDNIRLSAPESSSGFAMDAGFSNPPLMGLNMSDGSRRFREKFQAGDELTS
jgi:hypothetical protein